MMWLLYHLVHHENVRKQLLAELDTAFGHSPTLAAEKIDELQYFWRCVNESMRVTPSVIIAFSRKFPESRIVNQYRFPKDVRTVTLFRFHIHSLSVICQFSVYITTRKNGVKMLMSSIQIAFHPHILAIPLLLRHSALGAAFA